MKNYIGLIFGFVVIVSALISAILPQPFTKGNFTNYQIEQINNFYEIESQVLTKNRTQKAVSLDWFSSVDVMFENFVDTTIFDIKTQSTFVVERTGGIGHADIETIDADNTQRLLSILENSKISRRPMLARINNIWVACSLWTKIHGFGLISTNNLDGHLCLHFLNSKTDTTNKIDYSHQKTISQALKLSQKYFPNI